MELEYYGITIVQKSEVAEGDGFTFPQEVVEVPSGRSLTMERFTSAGEDAAPLKDDYALSVPVLRNGGAASSGFFDPVNEPLAEPGERRVYSRDQNGQITSTIWQRNDGTVEIENAEVTIVVSPNGNIDITTSGTVTANISGDMNATVNGTTNLTCPTTNVDGDVNCTGTITADVDVIGGGISLKSHLTTGVTPGGGTSGPPQ